jgi:hypothetical protein
MTTPDDARTARIASNVFNAQKNSRPIGKVTAPSFPATTASVTNTSGYPVTAFVAASAATITAVSIGGSVTGIEVASSGYASFPLPVGQSISFTYSGGTPTWTWFA